MAARARWTLLVRKFTPAASLYVRRDGSWNWHPGATSSCVTTGGRSVRCCPAPKSHSVCCILPSVTRGQFCPMSPVTVSASCTYLRTYKFSVRLCTAMYDIWLCGQNVELLNVKPGGTHSDHWALKGSNLKSTVVAIYTTCIQTC
jgi:hypothetical protein